MKSLKIIVAAALAASMLVGCGSTSDDKAIYNFSSEADVTSLDSSVSDDGVSFNAIHAFSEGLMDITAKGGTKLVPAAASSYKVSDDGLTYTFTIRKNAKWSNGDDLTADDFVYSWRKLIANAGSYAYIFGKEGACIKNADELAELGTTAGDKIKELGVEAKDKKTLQVTLSQPCPYFLEIMTFPCFYPQNQKFVEKCGSKYATDAKYLLANGPFKVTKWTKSNKITFEKNDKYYGADKIELDGLNMYLVQDPKTAAAAFDNGKVDFATINSALVDKYEGKDSLVKFKQGYMYYLYLNFNNKSLANTNIRKALSLAIDRKDLCNKVLKDGSREADGFVSADFTYGPDGKEYRSEGKDYYAIRAEDGKFYDRNGTGLAKGFLRFPTAKQFRISSNFNPRRTNPVTGRVAPHRGVDFAMPQGTPVLSVGDGEVVVAKRSGAAGYYVAIRHGRSYTTRYMHLRKILVKPGQKVKRGDRIALSGNTGRSTGPHLHYEVWINQQAVNPLTAKLPRTEGLTGSDRREFLAQAKEIVPQLRFD